MASLAVGFVDIVARGVNGVVASLNTVKNAMTGAGQGADKVNQKTDQMGKAAEKATLSFHQVHFALRRVEASAMKVALAITGIVGASLKLGAPKEVDDLGVAFKVAGMQIGTIFLPWIRTLTKWITELGNYLKSLTDKQKDNILRWTGIVLAISAGIVVAIKLVTVLRVLTIGFKAMSLAMGLTPIGIILVLAGVIVALVQHFSGLSEAVEKNGGIWETIKKIWASVQPIFAKVMNFIQKAMVSLQPVFDWFWELIQRVWQHIMALVPKLEPLWDALVGAVTAAFVSLQPLFDWLGGMVMKLVDVFFDTLELLIPYVTDAFNILGGIFQALSGAVEEAVDFIDNVLDQFAAVFSMMYEAVKPLLEQLQIIWDYLVQSIGLGSSQMGSNITSVKSFFKGAFDFILDMINQAIKGWIALSILVKRGLKFDFSGVQNEIDDAWKEFDAKVAKRKVVREDNKSKQELTDSMKEFDNFFSQAEKLAEDTTTGDHTPQLKLEKPELRGIADVWKQAQTTKIDDPQAKMNNERLQLSYKQLRESEKQTDFLEDIAGKKPGARD